MSTRFLFNLISQSILGDGKMLGKAIVGSFVVAAILSCTLVAQAVNIDLVPIGNLGNAADAGGYGSVAEEYYIGTYEVTTGQYTEFLNAVAIEDMYGLYNDWMANTSVKGCGIVQSGLPGSHTYSIAADRENRPVNFVSWADAARFANWMHNGQPTGDQGLGTTEDGAYFIDGVTSRYDLAALTRQSDATWFIPTEDEWYKAAYHDQSAGLEGDYFIYPIGSNTVPSNALTSPDGGNSANFYSDADGYTLDTPFWMSEVGAFENSASPYGTFDQGGNVFEWTEENTSTSSCAVRGGSYGDRVSDLASDEHSTFWTTNESGSIGFRMASTVPEPGSIAMLVGTALMSLLCYAWRKRK